MFDNSPVRTEELGNWITRLASLDADVADAERIRQLGLLESVKAAAAAAQARVAVDFDTSQRQAQRAAGVAPNRVGAGIAEQVALARRESPTHGSRHLGLAKALVDEMPHTLAALTQGRISEWRATLMVRATAVLQREDRTGVDAQLAGTPERSSDRAVHAAAQAAAYARDPDAFCKQGRRATAERRVTIRPALDLMANVIGFLPLAQGVAVFNAVHQAALARRAAGDSRSLDQIRADTFVERLTGQAAATGVPVEVEVIITDTALFPDPSSRQHTAPGGSGSGSPTADSAEAKFDPDPATHPLPDPSTGRASGSGSSPGPATGGVMSTDRLCAPGPASGTDGVVVEPEIRLEGAVAYLVGLGPIPAGMARDLIADAVDHGGGLWLRRVVTDPVTGAINHVDTRRRSFPDWVRHLVRLRDQWCRTPWCGAPIRHTDHVTAYAGGGPTSVENAQGLCERCNHAKEAPGWTARPDPRPGDPTRVITRTPTGHAYHSGAPPAFGAPTRPPRPASRSA